MQRHPLRVARVLPWMGFLPCVHPLRDVSSSALPPSHQWAMQRCPPATLDANTGVACERIPASCESLTLPYCGSLSLPLPCPICRTTYTKKTQKTCGAFLADDASLTTLAAAETKCASLGASCGAIHDKQCMGIFSFAGHDKYRLCDTSVALQPAVVNAGEYDCVFERDGAFNSSPPLPPSPPPPASSPPPPPPSPPQPSPSPPPPSPPMRSVTASVNILVGDATDPYSFIAFNANGARLLRALHHQSLSHHIHKRLHHFFRSVPACLNRPSARRRHQPGHLPW